MDRCTTQITNSPRWGSASGFLVGVIACIGILGSVVVAIIASYSVHPDQEQATVAPLRSVSRPAGQFEVTINPAPPAPRVDTGVVDELGRKVTVSCTTCHATRQPDFENRAVADLTEFHRGLSVSHGTISCLSCHNSSDYDALKLADGTRIEYADVMTLCAQCHGTQMQDYQRGVHGGMSGYWDLTRGPQQRNHCVDCHNPHAPQFPKMHPTFKPRDRFLEKHHSSHGNPE